MIGWAKAQVGDNTGALVEGILQRRKHPESGYRACLGVISLAKKYPRERMEAASLRLITAKAYSYQSLKSVLKAGLDRVPSQSEEPAFVVPVHQNIRGRDYFKPNQPSRARAGLPLQERN